MTRSIAPRFLMSAWLVAFVACAVESESDATGDDSLSDSTSASNSASVSDSGSEDDASTQDQTNSDSHSGGESSSTAESSESTISDSQSGDSNSTTDETTSTEEIVDCLQEISMITPEFLKEKLSMLSGETPAIIDGKEVMIPERSTAESRENARAWLKEQYEALGYRTWTEDYGNGGVNFLAQRDGESDDFLLIGAHLDSVKNAPGADDDGGGIIQGLAIATAIARCDLPYSVRFAGFDQEELGLLGSRAYAESLQMSGEIEEFRGLLQLEMPGYDSDGDGIYQLIDCDYEHSKHIREAVLAADEASTTKVKVEVRCESRSDHQSFWDIDKGAVMILERFFGQASDANRCYHQPCDKVDILDFEYMHGLTDVAARAAITLLEIPLP